MPRHLNVVQMEMKDNDDCLIRLHSFCRYFPTEFTNEYEREKHKKGEEELELFLAQLRSIATTNEGCDLPCELVEMIESRPLLIVFLLKY
jgi:hypothetical protein